MEGAMNNILLQAFFRHVGSFIGTALATHGWATEADAQLIGGAFVTLAMFAWSVIEKKGRE
jgi:hypothetical protein